MLSERQKKIAEKFGYPEKSIYEILIDYKDEYYPEFFILRNIDLKRSMDITYNKHSYNGNISYYSTNFNDVIKLDPYLMEYVLIDRDINDNYIKCIESILKNLKNSNIHLSLLKAIMVYRSDELLSHIDSKLAYKIYNLLIGPIIMFPFISHSSYKIYRTDLEKTTNIMYKKSFRYLFVIIMFGKTKKESCVGIIRDSPIYDKNVFRIILKLSKPR